MIQTHKQYTYTLIITANIAYMLGIVILVFQILMIILFGIFIRTDSVSTSSISSLDASLFFIASFAFLCTKHRNLDWTVLTNYLFIAMICFQINSLYYFFWAQAFAQAFTSTSSLSSYVFISGLEATLTVIITVSMFASRLTQMSIFVITMIEVFFFALNWGICRWGINAITGGGAFNIWLFGLIFASCIRKMRYPELKQNNTSKYFTKTLQLISLVVMIITWPSLNQLMAVLDGTVANLASTNLLQQNAYFQTWLCLFSCIVTTMGLRVHGERISLDQVIPSIINTGILISSCACVIIDPFASILIGICGPLLYYAYDRYGQSLKETGYPIDSIVMAILGGVLSAIFCGGRNGRTPALSSDAVKQGGLQFAALLVSLLFSLVFGAVTGCALNFFSKDDIELTDMGIWQIQSQMLPLYSDDPKLEKLYKIQDRQKLQEQNPAFSLKQRYLSYKKQESNIPETGKIIKQEIQNSSRIMGEIAVS